MAPNIPTYIGRAATRARARIPQLGSVAGGCRDVQGCQACLADSGGLIGGLWRTPVADWRTGGPADRRTGGPADWRTLADSCGGLADSADWRTGAGGLADFGGL